MRGTVGGSEDSTAILRVLRRTRDEAQLTQLLAAVAGDDEHVAGKLAGLLVQATRDAYVEQRRALGEVPERLRCRPEATLRALAEKKDHGRIDLRFDDAARDFTLLAELKLHSPYGDDQVDRYKAALDDLPLDRRSGLVAVTRNVPGVGEPKPGTRGWLGSLRWTDIYDGLLALPIRDAELRSQWRLLLGVIDEQGDFGVKELSREEIEAWAAYVATREKLERLIEDLAPKGLEHLQGRLAARAAWADTPAERTASLHTRGREQKVPYPTQTTVQARIKVPAEGDERVRIQFLGGFDQPYFTVEARRNGAPALLAGKAEGHQKFSAAVRWLTNSERGFNTDERHYISHVHPPGDWLDIPDDRAIGDALLECISADLDTLVESGILDPDSGFAADRGGTDEGDDQPEDEA
jgi:hypothetical protein